jgi:Uncharacterized protein with protein kinase and helix-hairpin-helix DNA-binding domains
MSHRQTTPQIVYDYQGKPQQLDKPFGEGGEAVVYPLAQRDDVLVKLYHPAELAKRGAALQQKVEAMRKVPALANQKGVSWPLISVFDNRKRWIGYAMYKGQGVPMFKLAHAVLYTRHFPNLDRERLTGYLISLVQQLKQLQHNGVMVGDYNLNNIICDPSSDRLTLIDCDSYQVRVNGQHFACPVGTPDMTPKEQHGSAFTELVRTKESEAFSLAIILFKCLMLGRHPYDIVGGDDPVANLKSGHFAYGIGNRGIPKGPWYNIWSHMPHRLKSHFITTFTEGADDPFKRTSLDEWLESLQLYRKEINKGWHEAAIRPDKPKTNVYRGNNSQISQSVSRC